MQQAANKPALEFHTSRVRRKAATAVSPLCECVSKGAGVISKIWIQLNVGLLLPGCACSSYMHVQPGKRIEIIPKVMYMYVQRKGLCGCIHNVNKFNVYSSEQIQNINPYTIHNHTEFTNIYCVE